MAVHISKITVSRPRETSVPVVIFSMIFPCSSTTAMRRLVPPRSTPMANVLMVREFLSIKGYDAVGRAGVPAWQAFSLRRVTGHSQAGTLRLATPLSPLYIRIAYSGRAQKSGRKRCLYKTRHQTIFFCMKIAGKVAVVTGGANGIGRALCLRFATEGAKAVIISDIDTDALQRLAAQISVTGHSGGSHPGKRRQRTRSEASGGCSQQQFGQIDIFCSNAGVGVGGGPDAA